MEIISDEDSLDKNKSVSVSYWETISNYYSESDDDSLPNLLIRWLLDSDNDDSSIKSMEDDLGNKSDDDFPPTSKCLAKKVINR